MIKVFVSYEMMYYTNLFPHITTRRHQLSTVKNTMICNVCH